MSVSLVKENPIVNAVRFYETPRRGLTSRDVVEYRDGTVVTVSRRAAWNVIGMDTTLRRTEWQFGTFADILHGTRENAQLVDSHQGERTLIACGDRIITAG